MSTVQSTQNRAERVDHEIRQGATFGPMRHVLIGEDGKPVDLTGATVRGRVMSASDPTLTVDLQIVLAEDPTEGYYEFWLDAATTAAMPCGPYRTSRQSRYLYDIEWVDTLGRVTETLWGQMTVRPEVTKDR